MTFIITFCRVYKSHVRLSIGTLSKRFVTLSAFIWSFTSMRALVRHQRDSSCKTPLTNVALGLVSLTVFPSQFKFDGNFVSLSPRFEYSDHYKILYMARQLCCRGMCKNLLRSDVLQQSYGKAKFPSNLNCGQKTVSETGP